MLSNIGHIQNCICEIRLFIQRANEADKMLPTNITYNNGCDRYSNAIQSERDSNDCFKNRCRAIQVIVAYGKQLADKSHAIGPIRVQLGCSSPDATYRSERVGYAAVQPAQRSMRTWTAHRWLMTM